MGFHIDLFLARRKKRLFKVIQNRITLNSLNIFIVIIQKSFSKLRFDHPMADGYQKVPRNVFSC
ncbi:hypothetical protein COSHB9_19550 [Companilactobacillus alimentarius]|nr:hypothetical protein LAL01_04260 [Companilactobacillus alimentarius]